MVHRKDLFNSSQLSLQDLCLTIVWFRFHGFGMPIDMEKAFLYVHLRKDDLNFTRCLWLSNPSDPESELVAYT